MPRITHLFVAAACLVPAANAQTKRVSPAALTNSYGAINNSIPWGPFVPAGNLIGEIMVQQIDDQMLGQAAVLQAMTFRHNYTAAHGAKTYTSQVTLANAATPAAGISTTFASNIGGGATVVFNGMINFPAVNPYVRPPAAFDAPVIFTTPHTHTGASSLLWEVIIFGATPVTPTQFYERGPGTIHTAGFVGRGCMISGGINPLANTGTTTSSATSTVTNNLTNGPLNAPGALMIGDTSDLFSGLPLPLNLGFIGSPTCDLNINALVFLPVTTTATGTAAFPIPFTMSPSVSGTRLRTQYLALDVSSIVTSNGLDHSVPFNATTGKPWPHTRVYANGWGATPPATGLLQINGLVTEYTY